MKGVISIIGSIAAVMSFQATYADDFDFEYREFVRAFASMQFDSLEPYFNNESKVGFGPAEEGYSGFVTKFSEDKRCHEKVVRVLEQGCKLNEFKNRCVAPPFSGSDVIGVDSRASFEFANGQLKVLYLICSGD